MEILSGNNTFSGGLQVANGILYTTVGAGGLTIGQLDAGNNYLGSGTIGITGGSLRVDTRGKATTISGSNATIAIGDAFMAFENGGAVTLGTNSVVTASNANAHFDVSGDLVMDGGIFGDNGATLSKNITLRFDTTTNTDDESIVSLGTNGNALVKGLRNIDKEGSGQTTLASGLNFEISENVRLYGGILQLTADNQITRASGTANLLLSGGALGVAGTSQEFAELQLQGAGGSLLLGANGQITFGAAGTGANWNSNALLAIQNTSGDWLTDGTGAYIRFLTDPNFHTDQLAQISLTGYESGVQVTNTNSYYYMTAAADALKTIEWTGAGGNNLWGTGSNWLGGVSPDSIDISVSIKDIDQSLASGTITITDAQTLSRLNVNSAQSAVNLGGSGTLVFNRSGTYAGARIAHTGGSVLTIGNATRLDTSIELAANAPVNTSYIKWTGAVGGTGGITKTGDGTLLLYNANNNYTGGFTWQDSSVVQLGGASTANTGGNYFGTGTLVIGNGGNTNYYLETYNAALATGGATSANNTTRTIGSDFILQGNLYHQFQTDKGSKVANAYAGVVSNIIFSGNGVFGDASAAGSTYIIDNVGSGGSSGVRSPYVTTRFTGNITGYANIKQMGYGTIYYLGDNSGFLGNYVWSNGHIYGARDNFLGSGTIEISSTSRHNNYLYSHNGSNYVTVSLSNPFLFSGDGIILTGTFNFDLDSSGTNAKSQITSSSFNMGGSALVTFGKDHVIEGSGQFRFGSAGSYGFSGIARFLGENTFTGGIITEGRIQAGRDSVWNSGTLVSGAFGVGTIIVSQGGYIGAYSDNSATTSIRVGNEIRLNSSDLIVVNGGNATTLILETGSIALRNGKTDLAINIGTAAHALSIESLLYDNGNPGGFTKTGAGTLILSNTANQISGGIEAQAGVVRAVMHGSNVTIGGGALTPFGTGELLTKTTTNTGVAGAFEIAADDDATVTITGTDPFTLNDNGRLRITGANITTVLADGGRFYSSDTGEEGSLVADYIRSNNYALGIKISAPLLEINTGKTLTLLKANLLNSAGTISLTTSSTLALGTTYQSLNLLVNGDSTVDVSGGSSGNAYTLNIKDIVVNSGTLWFAGWDGNIDTGLGNTIIYTDIELGRYIEGVRLGDHAATSVISLTNNKGDAVLLPFEGIFYWSGTNGGLWEEGNWNLSNHTHAPNTEPNLKDGLVRFNTDYTMYNEGNVVITPVAAAETFHMVNALEFGGSTPATSGSIRISATSGAGLLFVSSDANAKGRITQAGVTDVYLDTPIRLASSVGGVPKTLTIEQNGTGDLFMRGQITGALAVVEVSGSAGSGMVVFSSTNSTFSGNFILNSGDVRIGADGTAAAGPLGMGSLTFRSGTLRGTDASGLIDAERTLVNTYNLDGGVSIAGTKKLTLSGNGNITSDSVVNMTEASGTLVLGAAGQTLSGTNNLVFEGEGKTVVVSELNLAEVTVSGSLTELDGVISGTTKIIKTGTGTLLLLAENTHSGGVVMQGGITGINNNSALGTGTAVLGSGSAPFTSGTLRFDANNLSLANNFTLASTGEVDTQAHSGTLAGVISGAGNITKAGTGALTLTNAANTHSGTMLVRTGTLALAANNAAGASTIHVDSAARVNLSYTGSLANTVSGAGVAEVTGTVLVTGGAANDDFSGTWAVNDTMRIAESNAAGAASNIALAGLLQTTGTANITLSNTLTGGGTVQFAGSGTHKLGANMGTAFTGQVDANQGAFTWDANASAVLANNATLRTTGGWTDIAAGAQTANTLAIAGGTLAFTGTATVATLTIDAPASVLMDQGKLTAPGILRQDEARSETLVAASNNTWGQTSPISAS
ncbi:beta strand repeat-containing protein [Ereboglobus luteus]